MTDPQFGSNPGSNPGSNAWESTPPPQGSYPPPPPADYGQPAGQYSGGQYPPPPPPGMYYDPTAPYGRHPVTGEPFSEKSKLVAGLLQLLGLFGLVGVGRMYMGYVGLGVAQLIVGLVTCGIGAVVWGIIDAILILTDKVRDPQGRPLRDGT